jgi:hypothetical protein
MAVSGSKNFELEVTDYIEEAFERCGLELRTGYDLDSARRSLNLLLAEWANRGLNQWTVSQTTIDLVAGTASYDLDSTNPTAVIDVLDVVVREVNNSTNTDIQISRIGRAEYLHIPNKSEQARPSQYFVDKQITPKIYVYPTPDDSTDKLVVNRLMRMDDVDSNRDTLQLPFRFYPCLAAGLAYYIAQKRAPERMQFLKAIYEEEFQRAADQDEPRNSFRIRPDTRRQRSP